MKFSEITQDQDGNWTNNTNSFFLVIGIGQQLFPNPSSPGTYPSQKGILNDPNMNIVDIFYNVQVQIIQWNDTMTVWNGSAMESEPKTDVTAVAIIHERERMLVPPGYTLQYFGYAIGFWLDENEVEEYILGHPHKSIMPLCRE